MDVLKHAPFYVLYVVWRHFLRVFLGISKSPPDWHSVPLERFPKVNPPTGFKQYRWIAKLCAVLRLYMRTVGDAARDISTPLPTFSSCDITSILFELIYYADVLGKQLYISSQDIASAHDCVYLEDQSAVLPSVGV